MAAWSIPSSSAASVFTAEPGLAESHDAGRSHIFIIMTSGIIWTRSSAQRISYLRKWFDQQKGSRGQFNHQGFHCQVQWHLACSFAASSISKSFVINLFQSRERKAFGLIYNSATNGMHAQCARHFIDSTVVSSTSRRNSNKRTAAPHAPPR